MTAICGKFNCTDGVKQDELGSSKVVEPLKTKIRKMRLESAVLEMNSSESRRRSITFD